MTAKKSSAAAPSMKVLVHLRDRRVKPEPGSTFFMKTIYDFWLSGLVIRDDAEPAMGGWYLTYVLSQRLQSPSAEFSGPIKLLLPPFIMNRLGWTRGFFEQGATVDLKGLKIPKRHLLWDSLRRRHVDEWGEPLGASDIERYKKTYKEIPEGDYGVTNVYGLDEELSKILEKKKGK